MSFYNDEELAFVKKCEGIVLDAKNNNKITLFRFLNQREIEILKTLSSEVWLYIDSNSEEYKRAIVAPFEIKPEYKVNLIKINYNKKYLTPNHRMILGALMSLGIERNTIGDIYITTSNDVYFYATKEITPYIISEFRVLAHQAVELSVEECIIGEIKKDVVIKKSFVQSLRLDLIVAQGFNIARGDAQDIIKNGDCKVNQKMINNTSHILKQGDLISLKGYGRLTLQEVGGLSKNNKIHVILAKHV